MKTVWKFKVPIDDAFVLDLPIGARVVFVADQPGQGLHLWAEVDPSADTVRRSFAVRGTGHDVQDGLTHLGSVVQGPFVWHLYEGSDAPA